MLTFFNEQHAQQFGGTDQRVKAVQAELERRGLGAIVTPQSVPLTALERTHSPRYLAFLRNAWSEAQALKEFIGKPVIAPRQLAVRTMRTDIEPDDFLARLGLYSMDTVTGIGPGTWSAAKGGADCAVNAAHALRVGERGTFVLTQPQGHHAGADFCGGYCYLNNAALAAQHLLDDGMSKVAILDLDYQHGNGAQGIFYERGDVLCLSIHAEPRTTFPFYCGHADETGAGPGLGYNVNIPLATDANAQAWFAALETACVRLSMYRPEALVVALGGSIFHGEQHGGFGLTAADFLRLGERLAWLGIPTSFQLEGGTPLRELGTNIVNVLEGFDCAMV
ncbi:MULTISPECIES: histone deacetylase family protein [unclassified Duganella]|uniref:histone deacetylase family protein n=1 Tax=unclassified Duganella TaxID=2636909 RepID=UPI0006FF50F7|nr:MULTISPECIES: histone deacetylase family protein [unclassified Duganella]KQV59089.1 acetylpolyamine aminohydrolase [Duganella sp. Root336D2]KRB93387.1 acetylpolyamine aminohydrolase [Duganella sp. Root198D2]